MSNLLLLLLLLVARLMAPGRGSSVAVGVVCDSAAVIDSPASCLRFWKFKIAFAGALDSMEVRESDSGANSAKTPHEYKQYQREPQHMMKNAPIQYDIGPGSHAGDLVGSCRDLCVTAGAAGLKGATVLS